MCDPPRPVRMANSGLIGTLMGMVSMRVIFMSRYRINLHNGRARCPQRAEAETARPGEDTEIYLQSVWNDLPFREIIHEGGDFLHDAAEEFFSLGSSR